MRKARRSNLSNRMGVVLVVLLGIVGLCVDTAAALPGSGTQDDPWRIESLADFDEFAADPNYWSGFTRLETDVNLAGRTYTTAVIAPDVDNDHYAYDGTPFSGVFDGNDHKITNLTIDAGAGNDFLGLFGCINGGEVKNLRLEGSFVSGEYAVGGLVGANGEWDHQGGQISNCYSTGSVSGGSTVGGLVGDNSLASISDSYFIGDVNGEYSIGGLVGVNQGSVSGCYSTAGVNGERWVGGLVGGNVGSISNCYSTSDVNGGGNLGGLVGSNTGSVSDCYSTSDVNGIGDVGGLVGRNGWIPGPGSYYDGYIFNSYSIGNVQGSGNVGGLVGYNLVGDIERSFWDVQTSGEPNMCGVQGGETTGCDPNCGKTTGEMQTRSTFTDAGWDFLEIWLINEAATYPVLRQETRSDLNGDRGVDLLDFAVFADHWLEGKGN